MKTKKKTKYPNPIIYFVICFVTMIFMNYFLTNQILHNIFISTEEFNLIDIVYVQNTGAAFSSFQQSTVLLSILSILAIGLILYELFKTLYKYSLPFHFASAMLVSGIFCNTYERLTLGYVRDYISLKFIDFPVFNISDILINLGVLAIIILLVTKRYKNNE